MNPYLITLIALLVAFLGQLAATRLLVERFFSQPTERGRMKWLVLAAGMLLPAVAHYFTLELALKVGLYDFRQAILAAVSGLFCAFGCFSLCRRSA